jgi:hypothetical protein
MGYDTRVTGRVAIAPPLTWEEISEHGADWLPERAWQAGSGFKLVVAERTVRIEGAHPGAVGFVREASAVVPVSDGAYNAAAPPEDELRGLVRRFPGHRFDGLFEGHGADFGAGWRLHVRSRQVHLVRAEIVWPDPPPLFPDETRSILGDPDTMAAIRRGERDLADGNTDPVFTDCDEGGR